MNTAPILMQAGTSLAASLGNMAVFAIAALVLLFISVKVFDRALTRVDLEAEIGKGNIAAAIVVGSLVIGISFILGVAMM